MNEGLTPEILKKDYEKAFMLELRRKIIDHNMTHEQVAHILGKNRPVVSMALVGKASFTGKDMLLLAKFFKLGEFLK